jgi:hypothetical protein
MRLPPAAQRQPDRDLFAARCAALEHHIRLGIPNET